MQTTNMKKSEILKEAKKYLWDGIPPSYSADRYICHCLYEVNRANFCSLGDEITALRDWIAELLGEGNLCLESWLITKGVTDFSDRVKLQETRLNWLNWMIAYWEERGE